jgi:hypothetical protein
MRRVRDVLRGRYPTWPTGGYQQTDVRDVATLHAAVMSAGPRRYIVPGHHVDGRSMFNTLELVTGRRLRHVILPVQVMLPLTWVATAAQRVLPIHLPAEYEAILLHRYDTRYHDSRARKELGLQSRPLVDTYREAARWLNEAGWLNARQAGDVWNLQTADE